jgi:hypothetical protein
MFAVRSVAPILRRIVLHPVEIGQEIQSRFIGRTIPEILPFPVS